MITLTTDPNITGDTLESWSYSGSVLSGTPLVATSVLNPDLSAGLQYWIAVTAPSADDLEWHENSTGATSPEEFSEDDGAPNSYIYVAGAFPNPAFEVDSSDAPATPEPEAILLAGAGVLALAWRRRAAGHGRRLLP